jgi:hypothetical protein
MARKPRVYLADVDGVHEWAIAARNQQAALEALGVGQNLFAQGRAGSTTDPAAVEAAVAADGAPVRRLKGSDEPFHPVDEGDASGWAAALAAAPALTPAVRLKGASAANTEVPSKAPAAPPAAPARVRPEPSPARPSRRKAPDRRPLMTAEAELTAFGREEAKALGEIVREREALDRREAKVRADLANRREALERAVARARSAYEQR